MDINSVQLAEQLYQESKFWVAFATALWSVFKGVQWVKTIKTNDLHHLQLGMDDLHKEMKEQTSAIVGGLKEVQNEMREMRSDFRAYFPLAAKSARAAKR